MGYYTRFKMDYEQDGNIDEREIVKTLCIINNSFGVNLADPIDSFPYFMDLFNEEELKLKWYEFEKDMKKLSEAYPEIKFTLHGEGEDNDDLWNLYAYKGEIQIEFAKITYEKSYLW